MIPLRLLLKALLALAVLLVPMGAQAQTGTVAPKYFSEPFFLAQIRRRDFVPWWLTYKRSGLALAGYKRGFENVRCFKEGLGFREKKQARALAFVEIFIDLDAFVQSQLASGAGGQHEESPHVADPETLRVQVLLRRGGCRSPVLKLFRENRGPVKIYCVWLDDHVSPVGFEKKPIGLFA